MASTRIGHTCITCGVTFEDPDLQRSHYKTDWHRYNLKRKVAELNPITKEDFEGRMAKLENHVKAMNGEIKDPSGYCVCCCKHFATEKAYENHKQSKKHLEAEKSFNQRQDKIEIENNRLNRKPVEDISIDKDDQDDIEIEEVDSDEWDEDGDEGFPPTVCLFCDRPSQTAEKNVVHMSERHSFFLPDPEYLTDLEGLLTYLGAKVGQGHFCLWCNSQKSAFRSLAAVRKHMQDKGHAKILHEGDGLVEYSDFYDYTTSYPEGETGNDGSPDEEVQVEVLDDDCYELVLPSGARVGHRSLALYYKQSLVPDRALVVRKSHSAVVDHYRKFGWTGITSTEAKRKARDLMFMRRIEQKQWMKLGTNSNRLQRHFRDPTMMC